MLAMSLLLLAVFEPATTAASMAIDRPGTIADAPARGPERSGGRRSGDFLASRGMGFSPGEESLPDGVAAQAIEAQPVSGQISHQRGKVRPGAERHRQEKTWRRPVVPHKMSASFGAKKEAVEQEKADRGWFTAEMP
jgi:hypothetical protein